MIRALERYYFAARGKPGDDVCYFLLLVACYFHSWYVFVAAAVAGFVVNILWDRRG